ncbi:hypothetical protein MUCCIDRAFT_159352 [Mucor lusitanicus CBS 277.49]|uniref:PiggyBac transposable element-derived protein domain-containing protein n=1 Tax=Mucor lusitanicus CBS 277.49 TaxID=747725 RepID=A0A168QG98_MUCCL|nr:hypothetical protein MUCCIDRAFT_159352 [Mucor lusitanicus CBS 277.49]
MYDAILDEVPSITMTTLIRQGCLKYMGSEASAASNKAPAETIDLPVVSEDLLDDALQSSSEEDDVDPTPGDGWSSGRKSHSKLNMEGQRRASPLEYFLFFLPQDHFHYVIGSTNAHARTVDATWRDITYNKYMMWLALLTVMTVVHHSDRKAYWKQGSSHFTMSVNFKQYMSYWRFEDIMRMHTFEVPSIERKQADPLYQIRSTIKIFNEHMARCVVPGKYLVIDESMHQWLGERMPNLKKVPQKPHPIGQEFKTLADHHSYCILQMDTVSDPLPKEFDNDLDMKKLTAAVKQLVKPWIGSGRTVIADSWFGSPDMISMLTSNNGLHYTMKKTTDDGGMFVCAYREKKVKAFVSSCGTTRLNDQRTFRNSDVQTSTAQRPEVVGEYETHKSSIIDAASNLRDNKISYHDIISTDRWEMHYFGFFLGICEANAFSAYRVFRDGSNTNHSAFKDSLTWSFLRHCKSLNNDIMEPALPAAILRAARSCNYHNY